MKKTQPRWACISISKFLEHVEVHVFGLSMKLSLIGQHHINMKFRIALEHFPDTSHHHVPSRIAFKNELARRIIIAQLRRDQKFLASHKVISITCSSNCIGLT